MIKTKNCIYPFWLLKSQIINDNFSALQKQNLILLEFFSLEKRFLPPPPKGHPRGGPESESQYRHLPSEAPTRRPSDPRQGVGTLVLGSIMKRYQTYSFPAQSGPNPASDFPFPDPGSGLQWKLCPRS
jgi:hypothetical protein